MNKIMHLYIKPKEPETAEAITLTLHCRENGFYLVQGETIEPIQESIHLDLEKITVTLQCQDEIELALTELNCEHDSIEFNTDIHARFENDPLAFLFNRKGNLL